MDSVPTSILGLNGIGPEVAATLEAAGHTLDTLAVLTEADLAKLPGIGKRRAAAVRADLDRWQADQSTMPSPEPVGLPVDPAPDAAPAEPAEPAARSMWFYWASCPDGGLLLHSGLGYPGRKLAKFAGGYYLAKDTNEWAALKQRQTTRGDVREAAWRDGSDQPAA